MTEGSCSSVANAYIANKGGFNVLDYRDGLSRELFSLKETSIEMGKFNGVKSWVLYNRNAFKMAKELLNMLETGKEYKLGVGRHAAIVRKLPNGQCQYLELQSKYEKENGWHNFDGRVLQKRFACSVLRKYTQRAYLIDIESLAKSKEFIELMQYTNTAESAQIKGVKGGIK